MNQNSQTQERPAAPATPAAQEGGGTPPRRRPPAGRRGRLLPWLVLLVLAGTAAAAGWRGWQEVSRLEARLAQVEAGLEARSKALEQSLAGLRAETARQAREMEQRLAALEESLSALARRGGRHRAGWLLAEAEYFVRLAASRLALQRDPDTALAALAGADARLRETGDPALLPVRRALARDMAALRALPRVDLAGLSLELDALAAQVDRLPLATPDPASARARRPQEAAGAPAEGGGTGHWWDKARGVWTILRGLVMVRHHDRPIEPLLAPEQRVFLVSNIRLALEQARLALLRGEAPVYRGRLAHATALVRRYFDTRHAGVRALLERLDALAGTDIAPALPELTSLAALEQARRTRAGAGDTERAAP